MAQNLLNLPSFAWMFIGLSVSLGAATNALGDTVYRDYTQEQLDRNYNQAEWAPNIKQILERYDLRSEWTRDRLGEPERHEYETGDPNHPVQSFDLYRADVDNAPAMIYIHGGAWRAGNAESYHFPAPLFLDNDISYIALDFSPVQDVGLDGMISQIRHAIATIYNQADEIGVDRDKLYVSGHSSGGHLGGVTLITDWEEFDLPKDVIKGATLISGMYDLKPVRLSARSSYVPFTDEIEEQLSTIRHIDKINTPIILAVGDLETDEFKRQTGEFAQALKDAGKTVELFNLAPYNHFETMDDYGNPYYPVSAASIKQIKENKQNK